MRLLELSLASRIFDRGDLLVIQTPGNPTYYYGNFLIFLEPPSPERKAHWEAIFEREFFAQPESKHRLFAWDHAKLSPPTDGRTIEAFVHDGYEYHADIVMSARSVGTPPAETNNMQLRQLQHDPEWDQLVEVVGLASARYSTDRDSIRRYAVRKVTTWKRIVDRQRGVLMGCINGGVVEAFGLLMWQDRIGVVVEDYSRDDQLDNWLSLIHGAASYGLNQLNLTQVIVETAPRLRRALEGLGFVAVEQVGSVVRPTPSGALEVSVEG
jgi:hypothetical protein